MTKKTKLEETFNLPPIDKVCDKIEDMDNQVELYKNEMHELIARADKIDAALPQVGGLDSIDADYDDYAKKAIDAFTDLIDLSKNVEDRHVADIAGAASSMIGNALTAKTNKANRKLETIKYQLSKAKLEHEKEKLEFNKERYFNQKKDNDVVETEGKVVASRTDLIREMLEEMKNEDDQ